MSNHYVNMFRYNIDANQRVWECAMTLSDELYFKKLDYSQGAIFSQLIHTMGVEYWWLHFLRTGEIEFIEELDAFEDRAYFRAEWDRINAVNLAYLEQVTPDQLDKDVKPPFWATNEGPSSAGKGLCRSCSTAWIIALKRWQVYIVSAHLLSSKITCIICWQKVGMLRKFP